MISNKVLEKYKSSSKIARLVMKELISKIKNSEMLEIKALHSYGDSRIQEECQTLIGKYKEQKNCGVAFPTCISLNDCVGNYLYEESKNIIPGDIVKIHLGVNIGGCIVNLGETICLDNDNKYIDLLNSLQKQVQNTMISDNTNDDVKMLIESKCTESGCFPVENTTSYQHLDGQEYTQDSKYIITNYKKYYDSEGYLTVNPNTCFDLEKGEIYTVKLVIIPNNNDNADETDHEYIKVDEPHIYRFNDTFYDLKLKMSREFVSRCKREHGTNAFNCIEHKQVGKSRVAIKQCCESGILEQYPILYSKDKYNIYHKIFTIIVDDNKSTIL